MADVEACREGRPENEPEVTSLQERFIGESCRRASRVQRGWVFGSTSVAATTAALALFALIQSGEANSQRQLADEKARIAEDTMQVAQANADIAEADRRVAGGQRALASQRPIAGAIDETGGYDGTDPDLYFDPDAVFR